MTIDNRDDLRQRVFTILHDRSQPIVDEANTVFPHTLVQTIDAEYCARLGRLLLGLLARSVRDGRIDAHNTAVVELRAVRDARSLSTEQLFTLVYLIERSAVDELALDSASGATSELWPLVTQLLHRGAFDLLAALAVSAPAEQGTAAILDPLTTLHTRAVFDTVLAKELERAGRFGTPIALILFDVDRLAALNDEHGRGVGDRILERVSVLVRTFFRQHDWVARYADDGIAVLLTGADAEHAADLAERVRVTVQERLAFSDHRTDKTVPVTITAAVVNAPGVENAALDPERLMAEADAAVARAKQEGRNRVARTTYEVPPRRTR